MCLNEKMAASIENIPIKFIKISSECISAVLSNIFNKCIQDGVFPSKLKVAKITPIHKGGCAFKATNYRPILVLSPFSKIFEKIIYKRLNKYLTRHNILAKKQTILQIMLSLMSLTNYKIIVITNTSLA